MEIETLIAEIDAEIARLQQARALLAGSQVRTTTASAKKPAKLKLSAAARERIAAAQRKRWAKANNAMKTAPVKAAKKVAAPAKIRGMSAAARKRIAAAQRKRWAGIKAAEEATKKAPAKKAAAVKKTTVKKAPAAKAKEVVPEKATPASTEAVAS